MASAIELKSPDGTNKFRLEHTENTSRTIDASKLRDVDEINELIYNRVGSGGSLDFRNKIIDGRFDFWHEGTSSTATAGYGTATMFKLNSYGTLSGVTINRSRRALAVGDITDVPSAKYYHRTVITDNMAATDVTIYQYQVIESVHTLNGKTVTISFYAKSDVAGEKVTIELSQVFGTGGSTQVNIPCQTFNLTTSWTRYTATINIPSTANKTIGSTADYLILFFWLSAGSTSSYVNRANTGQQTGAFDITCVQVEEGSIATPFEELPIEISTIRLQRYFKLVGTTLARYVHMGICNTTSQASINIPLAVSLRTDSPAVVGVSGVRVGASVFNKAALSVTAFEGFVTIAVSTSGLTSYSTCLLATSGVAYLDARL